MADKWYQTTLGSIASKNGYGLVDGPFGSNLPASCYTEAGIPVIRGSNLTLGSSRFRSDDFVFVSSNTAKRLERSLCRPLDIIFTKKGTLGQTGLVPEGDTYNLYLLSSNQMKLTVDRSIADPLFVYYFVSSPSSIEKIIQDSESTGVPKTNITYLRGFPITLPSLSEQRSIASLLGALDDKIELNRQMNKTLEAIARLFFKDWFVDFGPTRAKAEGRPPYLAPELWTLFPDALDDDDTPVGWKSVRLGDIAEGITRTVDPSEVGPETPYIGLEHMPRRSIALDSWEGAGKVTSGKLHFTRGEFLFGKLRPYFHKVGVAPIDGICSTDIVVCKPKRETAYSLVLSLISSDEFVAYTDQTSTGTKMPRTSWSIMARYEITLPQAPILEAFNNLLMPWIEMLCTNIHESRALAQTRDLLLPKLMSGEICLREAEKMVEKVA